MSAWTPAAPCTPRGCVSGADQPTGPALRLLRLAGFLAVVAAGLLLASPVRRGAGRRQERTERLVRLWARLAAGTLGVRIRVLDLSGDPRGGAELVVANHVSWLDVLALAAVRPGRMLAKSEVSAWPVVGRAATRCGTVFLDRARLRTLPGAVAETAAVLRGGGSAVVFPEGTTWCGARAGRFRAAFFQAALDAGVPVRPVAVRYRLTGGRPATAPAFVGEDDLVSSLRRVLAARGLVAELVLLPPIPAGSAPDRGALAEAAQRAVRRVLRPDPQHPAAAGAVRAPAPRRVAGRVSGGAPGRVRAEARGRAVSAAGGRR